MMQRDRRFAEEMAIMQEVLPSQSLGQVGGMAEGCTFPHRALQAILWTLSVYMCFIVLISYWFSWARRDHC